MKLSHSQSPNAASFSTLTDDDGGHGFGSALLSSDDSDIALPSLLDGRYQVVAKLGCGAFAEVLLGQGRCPDGVERWVAIKRLHPRMQQCLPAVARLRREAVLLRELWHPGLPVLHDWLPSEFALVLQQVPGEHLTSMLCESRVEQLAMVRAVFRALLEVLCYLHARSICHRDVKPRNTLVDWAGDGAPRVTLLDLGLATQFPKKGLRLAPPLTHSGVPIGTPRYMSPEQCRGRGVSFASDVYAVGVMLYEALCGHHPYSAQTAIEFHSAHQCAAPAPVTFTNHEHAALLELALAALSKEPASRPSANELYAALCKEHSR